MDRQYPIKKLIPNHIGKHIDIGMVNDEFKKKMLKLLSTRKRQIEALTNHDLFKKLSGNPTSIVILASILVNPLFTKCLSIHQLYKSAIVEGEQFFDYDLEDASQNEASGVK